jgi:autotransporter passenger strand-loop-strand repeat protein
VLRSGIDVGFCGRAAGQQTVYGISRIATIAGGTQTVYSGGSATETHIYAGTQHLLNGATATNTVINSGGRQNIYNGGKATTTFITGYAMQNVEANGTAYSTTIQSDGKVLVTSSGTGYMGGTNILESGGTLELLSGGTLELLSGGTLTIQGASGRAIASGSGTLVLANGSTLDIGALQRLTVAAMTINAGATIKIDVSGISTAGIYNLITATNPITAGSYISFIVVGTANKIYSLQLSADGKTLQLVAENPILPQITGPTSMTLTEGYATTSTEVYTVTGFPSPAVTKVSGNAAITWNSATMKFEIAAGLPKGIYVVELKASNGFSPDAMFTFTLTVEPPS